MKTSYSVNNYPAPNETYGKFVCKTPLCAAKKGFNLLHERFDLKNLEKDEKRYLQFSIINNHTKQIHKFLGVKIILKEPIKKHNKVHNYKLTVFPFPKNLDVKEVRFG